MPGFIIAEYVWQLCFIYVNLISDPARNAWAHAPNCYLGIMFDKLQKQVCRAAYHMRSLVYCRNWTSLNLFYIFYVTRYSSELVVLFFFYIFWRSNRHPGWLHGFSVAILRCHIDIYVPWTVRLWIFLTEECFPLTYDLKSLNSNCRYGVNLIKIITVKPILDHAYVLKNPL